MTTADPAFPSLLDAILHYYPISHSKPNSPVPSVEHAADRANSLPLPPLVPNGTTPPRISRFLSWTDKQQIHAPVPKHPQPNHASTLRPPGAMDGSPGSSPGKPRSIRASPSPSRGHHHGLSALSPLQMFSPLEGGRQLKPKPRTPSDASMTSGAGLSRSSSVTRSLSRRQSLIASAAKWSPGQDYEQENYAKFSRLTIVKAPAEKDKGMQQ